MAQAEPTLPSHPQVICSLFEGAYHVGLAALVNSLVQNGFTGLFYIGYRGALPPWLSELTQRADGTYEIPGSTALLHFDLLTEDRPFTLYKPEYLLSLFDRGIASDTLWYFDPDITVQAPWEFFERWAKFGVSLCQEIIHGTMPANHPLRLEWIEHAKQTGWGEPVRTLERYVNGGFIAMHKRHADFLHCWAAAMQIAFDHGVDPRKSAQGTRAQTYYMLDQDTLNVTAMYSPEPISIIGPEGMGFIPGYVMYHSTGPGKPWRKQFLRGLLAGYPPTSAEHHFFQVAGSPLHPYTPEQLRQKRLALRIAALLGRFYRRD